MNIVDRTLKFSENLFFLPYLKRGKSLGKFGLFKQIFLIKSVKADKY